MAESDNARKIVEILLAAGYERANVSTLSRFDKIIGGLIWCIQSSNIDVDADLCFQENARIGQKIEMGEKIEQALVQMKCPYRLRSSQIQGLDALSLLPVIIWLTRKVIEAKKQTGDQ
eukprot:TRINITY_DN21841_c0_g1_i1.p1 TRINITY_DN21841_c0_g1~~TRINITY_DN21841_c0_g1_i1.p1  ORF type:complete len:118 (-),score=17.65 TRINITY_DN21841_c0_g1_i1:7-360(-)